MNAPLPLMSEEEVLRCRIHGDEPGLGGLRTPRGLLPLVAVSVKARVVGLFAQTTVEQTFVNAHQEPLEATYIFPLPDRAAVTRFSLTVNGRVVDGVLQERAAARRTYDAAIQQGHRASIAEEERPGVFTMRVGNLMPGERATVTLEMTGPLPFTDGEATFRFPLVVAPRYIPGAALGGGDVGDGTAADTDAVPDASRISPPVLLPGFPNPVRLAIAVEVDPAGLPMSALRSSLHAASAAQHDGVWKVDVAPGERLDRDFLLRFKLGDDAVRTSVKVLPVDERGAGTFLLTVLPPANVGPPRPKDVVFVLDRSGSMEGWKMVAARRAVARMIDALRVGDRFTVIAFDDAMQAPTGLAPYALVDATDQHRFRAVEWLAQMKSGGGTEMAAPLSRAADLLAGGYLDRDRVLVFVTDGQVGNESQIVKLLGNKLKGTRVFALGIDQAVNAAFMNRLAQLGGQGEAELCESEDRLDEVLERAHRRIDAPLVAELSLAGEGLAIVPGSTTPARLPDVFAGVPAVVLGRFTGDARGAIVVQGRGRGAPFSARATASTTLNPAIRGAWARLRLRDLEDRFDAGADRAGLEREIVDTSLRFGVLCRFTAFVAVDRVEVVNKGGAQHHVVQAVDAPAGWAHGSAEQAKRRSPASPTLAAAPRPARLAAAPAPPASMDDDDDAFSDSEPMLAEEEGASTAAGFAPAEALSSKTGGVSRSRAVPSSGSVAQGRPETAPSPTKKPGLGDALGALGRALGDAVDALSSKKEAPVDRETAKDAKAEPIVSAPRASPKPAPSGGVEAALRALLAERLGPLLEQLRVRATLTIDEQKELVVALGIAAGDLVQELAAAGVLVDERRALEAASAVLRPASAGLADVGKALDDAAKHLDRFGVTTTGRAGFWK